VAFEILVGKELKDFLDVSSLWEKKRRKPHFNDLSLGISQVNTHDFKVRIISGET